LQSQNCTILCDPAIGRNRNRLKKIDSGSALRARLINAKTQRRKGAREWPQKKDKRREKGINQFNSLMSDLPRMFGVSYSSILTVTFFASLRPCVFALITLAESFDVRAGPEAGAPFTG
jgi:hypothetical protein